MTVSSNPIPDFSRDQILTAAIRLTGILSYSRDADADQILGASYHLNMALQDLQSDGLVLTTASRTTLALTASTAEYTLSSDVLDVELGQDDTAGTIINSGGTAETIVKAMSRGEYQTLAVKTVTGLPSRCYVERRAPLKLVFWPVPNSSSLTFRYTQVKFLRAADNGAVTMDTQRTAIKYLTYATASGVAFDSNQPEKGSAFRGMAAEERERFRAGDKQHGTLRFRVGHVGRNW